VRDEGRALFTRHPVLDVVPTLWDAELSPGFAAVGADVDSREDHRGPARRLEVERVLGGAEAEDSLHGSLLPFDVMVRSIFFSSGEDSLSQ